MHKILIVVPWQYGYNSDMYFYSKYLKKHFEVSYLGIDVGKKIITTDGIMVNHISYQGMLLTRIKMFKELRKLNKMNSYDFIFMYYFPLCSLLLLFLPRKILTVDIRTSFIIKDRPIREYMYNLIMKKEFELFHNRTIISKSLADYLHLHKPVKIFPLGGEFPEFKCAQNNYESIRLLYIGTFYDRNIELTIIGLRFFLERYSNIDIKYTIIGFGEEVYVNKILHEIRENNLEDYVNFLGEVRHPENIKYFLESNVGVSFVPCLPCYDCQPPTKTFEYLAYGLPVIATKTKENSLVISERNGILIDDTAHGFCEGIIKIVEDRLNYNTVLIQEDARKYSWESIVDNILQPSINEMIN